MIFVICAFFFFLGHSLSILLVFSEKQLFHWFFSIVFLSPMSVFSFIISFCLLWYFALFLGFWGGRLDYWFKIFPFSYVCIWFYISASQHCLSHVPNVDILYFLVHSVQCIFCLFFLRLPLWPMNCIEMCCLVSKC